MNKQPLDEKVPELPGQLTAFGVLLIFGGVLVTFFVAREAVRVHPKIRRAAGSLGGLPRMTGYSG